MKIVKFALTAVAYAKVYMVAEALRPENHSEIATETHSAAVVLQAALQCIPHYILEFVLRNHALSLSHHISEEVGPFALYSLVLITDSEQCIVSGTICL